jgi:nucleoside-diphosphate-sugar epimerase
MNLLVTGSSGPTGSAIAQRLRREARVAGLDLQAGPETTTIGDIGDQELVRSLMRGVYAVVHTAALHVPHLAAFGEEEFRRVNVEGTRVLLGAAAAAGVSRFVLTSTTSVYGCSGRAGPPATWADESLTPRPSDVYDRTKLEAEELCRQCAGSGMSVVILRMTRCFPEPEPVMAFYRMYRGVDRRDVAEAHSLALHAAVTGSVTLNLSAASPFHREDLAALWDDPWEVIERRVPGVRAAFQRRGWPLPQRIDRVYPIDRAARVLGYQPRQGIARMLGLETR